MIPGTGSPAIDSGLPVGSLGGLVPAIDIDLQLRPRGSGVDRGAYEYCTEQPVRRPAAPSTSYTSVSSAYTDAVTGEEISIRGVTLTESVTFNRSDIAVTLKGGFNCDFILNPYQATIAGLMSIDSGTVVLDKIILQ